MAKPTFLESLIFVVAIGTTVSAVAAVQGNAATSDLERRVRNLERSAAAFDQATLSLQRKKSVLNLLVAKIMESEDPDNRTKWRELASKYQEELK